MSFSQYHQQTMNTEHQIIKHLKMKLKYLTKTNIHLRPNIFRRKNNKKKL